MKIMCAGNLAASFTLVLAAMLAPAAANAGCGSFTPGQLAHFAPAPRAVQSVAVADAEEDWRSDGRDSIVGMWKVQFTATDGSGYTDFGYSQWHSDGTEMLNSGVRAPATQNYCLGVWEKTGNATYKLNHFALSYDQVSGDLNHKVKIREEVKVSPDGNTFWGSFTITLYDPTGTTVQGTVKGDISGTRVTVNTETP